MVYLVTQRAPDLLSTAWRYTPIVVGHTNNAIRRHFDLGSGCSYDAFVFGPCRDWGDAALVRVLETTHKKPRRPIVALGFFSCTKADSHHRPQWLRVVRHLPVCAGLSKPGEVWGQVL